MKHGAELENRMATPDEEPRRGRKSTAPWADRLSAARAIRPPALSPTGLHCGHCWGLGRDAAIQMIEEADSSDAGTG